jgi:hypothetical protein
VVEKMRTWVEGLNYQLPPLFVDIDPIEEKRRRAGVARRRNRQRGASWLKWMRSDPSRHARNQLVDRKVLYVALWETASNQSRVIGVQEVTVPAPDLRSPVHLLPGLCTQPAANLWDHALGAILVHSNIRSSKIRQCSLIPILLLLKNQAELAAAVRTEQATANINSQFERHVEPWQLSGSWRLDPGEVVNREPRGSNQSDNAINARTSGLCAVRSNPRHETEVNNCEQKWFKKWAIRWIKGAVYEDPLVETVPSVSCQLAASGPSHTSL